MRDHDWNGIPRCFVCGREVTGWPGEECRCLIDERPRAPLVVRRWTTGAILVALFAVALGGVGVKVW